MSRMNRVWNALFVVWGVAAVMLTYEALDVIVSDRPELAALSTGPILPTTLRFIEATEPMFATAAVFFTVTALLSLRKYR